MRRSVSLFALTLFLPLLPAGCESLPTDSGVIARSSPDPLLKALDRRLSRGHWQPHLQWSVLDTDAPGRLWQFSSADDKSEAESAEDLPWDGFGTLELSDRVTDPARETRIEAALNELATQDGLVGWNAAILLAQRNPSAALRWEPTLAALAGGQPPEHPETIRPRERTGIVRLFKKTAQPQADEIRTVSISVAMQAAAAEAWCLVLLQQDLSLDVLIPAGRLLERADLPNETRATLFRCLAQRVPPDRIPRLANALRMGESEPAPVEIRRAAIEACVVHGRAIDTAEFTSNLWPATTADCRRDPDAHVRVTWGRWLALAHHPDAVSLLQSQLHDTEAVVRDEALISLGLVGSEAARRVLKSQSRSDSELVRTAAVRGLARVGTQELAAFADDPAFRVRVAVAEELARAPEAASVLLLRRLVRDRNLQVQQAALDAVIEWPRELALPVMFACLRESSLSIRQACVALLRERFDIAITFPVEGTPEERDAAVLALARNWNLATDLLQDLRELGLRSGPTVDDTRVAEIEADLRIILKSDATEEDRQMAHERLLRVTADELPTVERYLLKHTVAEHERLDGEILPSLSPVYRALAALKSRDVNVRRTAARELKHRAEGANLSPLAVRRLRERLSQEQDRLVWQDCMDAILADASDEAAAIALLAVNHLWPDIRLLGCRHIERHPRSEYAIWLLPLLRDANGAVQLAAVRTLGLCGNRIALDGGPFSSDSPNRDVTTRSGVPQDGSELLPGLRSLLTHPDRELRFAAVVSMCRLGDEQASQELIRMAYDPNTQIRRSVVAAMGETGQTRFVEPLIQLAWTERSDPVRLTVLRSLDQLVPAATRPVGLVAQPGIGDKIKLWVEWWSRRTPATGSPASAETTHSAESTDDRIGE